MKKYKLSVTTDTAGDGTATGPNILGRLYAVDYVIGTLDSTTTDITVSTVNADAASNLLVVANVTASKIYYPRTLEHLDSAGSNLTTHDMPLIAGTIKLTIAQGGDTKTGHVVVFYLDD